MRSSYTPIAMMLAFLICNTANADRVNWSSDVESALRSASGSGRLVLLKFTADWCGYCKKMERETFTQPAVAQVVNQNFVPVLIDADQHKELVQSLKVTGLPALLVVSPQMVILSRISGFQTEEKLLPKLQAVLQQHAGRQAPQNAGTATVSQQPAFAQPRMQPVSQPSPAPTMQTAQAPVAAPAATNNATVGNLQPAFGGLCLPAVRDTRSLVSGTPQFKLAFRGRTLHFSNQKQLEAFRAAPQNYWPAIDGWCPVTMLEQGTKSEGMLEYAAMFRGKLWATNSQENMTKFVAQPAHYVDGLTKRQPQ